MNTLATRPALVTVRPAVPADRAALTTMHERSQHSLPQGGTPEASAGPRPTAYGAVPA